MGEKRSCCSYCGEPLTTGASGLYHPECLPKLAGLEKIAALLSKKQNAILKQQPNASKNSLPLSLPGEYPFKWVRGEYKFVPAGKIDIAEVRDFFCDLTPPPLAPALSPFQKYIRQKFGYEEPSDSALTKILKKWFSDGAIRGKRRGKVETYEPMEKENELLAAFAAFDADDIDSVLAFANSWGLLGFFVTSDDVPHYDSSTAHSRLIEPVRFLREECLAFQHTLRFQKALEDKDVSRLRELWLRLNNQTLGDRQLLEFTEFGTGYELSSRLKDIRLVVQGSAPFQRGYSIPCLLDAIWLKLYLYLTDQEGTLRYCDFDACRRPFPAKGKRKYCCEKHERAQTARNDRAVRTFAKSRGLRYEKLSKKKHKELKAQFKKLNQKERGENERPSVQEKVEEQSR